MRRFGPLQVLEMYGLTEGSVATFNYTGQLGAVGRASWLYKVKGGAAGDPAGRRGVSHRGDRAGSPFPQHVFPFSLIRCDVATGEPFRDPRGRCVATAPGAYPGGVGKLTGEDGTGGWGPQARPLLTR